MEAPEAIARTVVEDGFAIVPEAATREQVAAFGSAALRCMEELGVPFGPNEFLGARTRRLFNLLARDPVFAALPLLPAVLPVVEAVLDRECLLSSLTAICMEPGQAEQPLHADDGTLPLPRPHPPLTCTAILALSDFSEANGGTRIVPGSHRSERRPRAGDAPPTRAVEMRAGSALVYHGSLWHGGGANRTDAPRLAVVVNYCAGFLRQEECQLLALSREQVRGFPPRLQRLLGYGTYRGLLGHVDQQSPETFVNPDATTDMVWRRMKRRPG